MAISLAISAEINVIVPKRPGTCLVRRLHVARNLSMMWLYLNLQALRLSAAELRNEPFHRICWHTMLRCMFGVFEPIDR